jgi:GTPase SAR1 family protein
MTRHLTRDTIEEQEENTFVVRAYSLLIVFFCAGMAARGASSRQSVVKAKVVLLGEGAVGKTSIVLRYFENKFNDKHEQTLQV